MSGPLAPDRGAPRLGRGGSERWGGVGGHVGAARAGSRSATAWPGRFRALGGVGGHVGAPHVNGRARLTHAISPLFEAISRTTALILLTAVVIRSAASLVALLGAR